MQNLEETNFGESTIKTLARRPDREASTTAWDCSATVVLSDRITLSQEPDAHCQSVHEAQQQAWLRANRSQASAGATVARNLPYQAPLMLHNGSSAFQNVPRNGSSAQAVKKNAAETNSSSQYLMHALSAAAGRLV